MLSTVLILLAMVPAVVEGLPECSGLDKGGCATWRTSGFCADSLYRKFMEENCGATCGLCQAPPTPPPSNAPVDSSACLQAHNAKRALHDASAITWNSTLAASAAQWALHLANQSLFQHQHGNFGENLYQSGTSGSTVATCADAVANWYSEVGHYNFATGQSTNGQAVGHFTQEVWKATTSVGVGKATYYHNGFKYTVVVARYSPAGNVIGHFVENVENPN